MIDEAVRARKPRSIGLLGNAAEILPELVRRGVQPDAVTDQTSAHDPVNGYLPKGWTLAEWEEKRAQRSRQASRARRSNPWPNMSAPCWRFMRKAFRPSTTATTSARWRRTKASPTRSIFRASCRPISVRCSAAASDRSAGSRCRAIRKTSTRPTQKVKELLPHDKHLHHWLDMAREKIASRACPRASAGSASASATASGLAFNEMVAKGEVKAPIVIGRDHLDSGSVASPNRETEAMKDGSDAVSDWPLLNALLNCAGGATWVSFHHGGGVGMGYSQHAGMVIVCDGTEAARKRIARVLWNDPATGVMRHADAGYEIAHRISARSHGLDLPSLG